MTWHPDIPDEYRNQIVTGDARELAKRIPDESVDLIVIDPPWDTDSLPLYVQSARMAKRLLADGGYLLAYLSKIDMPLYTYEMCSYLTWEWQLNIFQPNSEDRFFPLNVFPSHRPIGLWSKNRNGNKPDTWCPDALRGTKDKFGHKWGQPFDSTLRYIEWLSHPNGIIVDFFCGGGLIPLICKMLGRNYIAFEIDPQVAEAARQRVLNTQPPLFVLEPEQMELSL